MASCIVPENEFIHMYSKNIKKENCYKNIRISTSVTNATFCTANSKFLAIIIECSGGGAFSVLPHDKAGTISEYQLINEHEGPVTDISFCPHDEFVIASGSEDKTIKIWNIIEKENSLIGILNNNLKYHNKRINKINWNPVIQDILVSAGHDKLIILWNQKRSEPLQVINHSCMIYSITWDWEGSNLVLTSQDKRISIIDTQKSCIIKKCIAHKGPKPFHAIFLRDGRIFSAGFNEHLCRECSLRTIENFETPFITVDIDSNSGVIFPLYDVYRNIIYLSGRGESMIKYYKITRDQPFIKLLGVVKTSDPWRGIAMLPKRDSSTCEIARIFHLNNSGFCQQIAMFNPKELAFSQESESNSLLGMVTVGSVQMTEINYTKALKAKDLRKSSYPVMDELWSKEQIKSFSIKKIPNEDIAKIRESCEKLKKDRNKENENDINLHKVVTDYIQNFLRLRKKQFKQQEKS